MSDTKKYLKMSLATSCGIGGSATNAPPQFNTHRKQYMAQQTRAFEALRAEYASDVDYAECQGINPDDFYEFVGTDVRFSDVANQSSSKILLNDDRKEVMFIDGYIEYFPIGAKLVTCGSTWICINPSNISSAYATAVVRRCNASYNSYDEYGNIITEPIIVESYQMTGTENMSPDNMMLMEGNFKVICQLNDNTRKLDVNKRIILGKKAYYITGFTDFLQEFSGDRNSVHLLTFTVRLEEPTKDDDISDDFVADASDYVFSAQISGQETIAEGQTAEYSAVFLLNGSEVTDVPVEWQWESSDENVATVDRYGHVTGTGAGECEIKAVLSQNKAVSVSAGLQVNEALNQPHIQFVGLISNSISQWFSETYTAAFFEADGIETDVPIKWEIDGVPSDCYDYTISDNGKTISVICLKSCEEKMRITASHGEARTSVDVELYGY